jgi:hypothetical protein
VAEAPQLDMEFICANSPFLFLARRNFHQTGGAARHKRDETAMFDVTLVAAGIAFFVVAILYAVACDRL